MSPAAMLVLCAGGLVGLGAAVTITALLPFHPALPDALARLDERHVRGCWPVPADASTGGAGAARRWLVAVMQRLPIAVPDGDLEIIGWTRDRYLLGRLSTAVAYTTIGPLLAAVTVVIDAGLPIVVPTAFGLAAGATGWLGYARTVQARAEDAREEMRYALVAYLQQVSLLRHGGAGVSTALTVPAQLLADSWAMRRIADQLEAAERAGLMPWDGLRRFGEQTGVAELADLSVIAETAGHDGGAVVDTLLVRAEGLRDELLADEHTSANRASARMSTPGALQVFLIAGWVLYPAVVALLAA